jgi:hypothetical protein
MPRTGDYSLGKIYKLVSDFTDDIYIGSTCQRLLSSRLTEHNKFYKKVVKGTANQNLRSSEIVKYGDCKIILIEHYPCASKYELEARERYHIENNKCVNKNIPTRSRQEYYEEHKEAVAEYKKTYADEHKEAIAQYKQQYYEANKESIHLKQKAQYQEHRQDIIRKNKEYREANKEKIYNRLSEVIECEFCKSLISRAGMTRHHKSKKCKEHQDS